MGLNKRFQHVVFSGLEMVPMAPLPGLSGPKEELDEAPQETIQDGCVGGISRRSWELLIHFKCILNLYALPTFSMRRGSELRDMTGND